MKRLSIIATYVFATLVHSAAWAGDDLSKSQSNSKESSNSSQNSEANYELTPTGWVQMAVDYDNDGMFDAIETIYAYDFEKARKSSQQRANRDASEMFRKQKNQSGDSDRGAKASATSQLNESVSGKLLQLRDEQIMGMDEPCVVARIRNQNNMPAKAVLGPKSEVDSWGLAEGDDITVQGRRGRVNDRPMLLATQVSWGDKTKQVELPSSRNSKRVKAEILSLRTTEFQGHEGKFVIAQIQTQNGKKCVVNLGSKSKVDQLNLSQGDELRMVVRPAKMNGKPGMVADEIMAGGKSVNVSPPKQIARRGGDRSDEKPSTNRANQDRQTKSSQDKKGDDQAGAAALGIAIGETGEGVVVIGIHPQSPLAKADIRVGDAIKSINDQAVESTQGLISMISGMEPGKQVTIVTDREGKEHTAEVKLTSRERLMQSYR